MKVAMGLGSKQREEWKPIPSWPGHEASSYGRIRNVRTGKVRNVNVDSNGYLIVSNHGIKRLVHQLVLEAFHGPKPDGEVSRHLDGNKRNNFPDNLSYGTHAENTQDAREHGTLYGIAKTQEEAQELCRRYANGETYKALANEYGCTESAIRALVSRKRRAEYMPAHELPKIEQRIAAIESQKRNERERMSEHKQQQKQAERLQRLRPMDARHKRCVELYKEGNSLNAIARAVGYADKSTVKKALRRAMSDAERADFEQSCSDRENKRHAAAAERASKCLALREQGLSLGKIAERVGISESQVFRIIRTPGE